LKRREISYKREIGWLGSFALGYGDVGPNIFIALGVITLFAGGAAPIAFALAATLYAIVGLVYAELAPTYPYAGGVHVYTIKAYNSFLGFVSGWSMVMAYVLCLSLFSVAAAGYLSYLIPSLSFPDYTILSFTFPGLGVLAALLASLLVLLNILGIKYSSLMVTTLVFLGLFIEALILSTGFVLKFDPDTFIRQVTIFGSEAVYQDVYYPPFLPLNISNFLYAVTLAMASFVGIESIAQAAEETRRPHFSIPKAAKMVVLVVAVSAILFPVLAVGSLDWRDVAAAYESPISKLVSTFPFVGPLLTPLVSLAAFILCYSSANTGLVGVSRLTASMGRFKLIPSWFYAIHQKFRTPYKTIIFFGAIGIFLALLGNIPFLASLYAFSAVISYVILMPTYLRLRRLEKEVYTPWQIPGSIKTVRGELPIFGLIGFAGLSTILVLMAIFHTFGKFLTAAWMLSGIALYIVYRKVVKASVIGEKDGRLVEPLSYRVKVGVLVRPYENIETAYRSIVHSFDKRFDIVLVSIVEEIIKSDKKMEEVKKHVIDDLMYLCKRLRRDHYNVEAVVEVGNFEEVVSRMLDEGLFELVAYIQRRAEKLTIEKGHEKAIHSLMIKYPGRIISLKRVGE